jgi:hypothetical protein
MSTNPLSKSDTKIKVANSALQEIGVGTIASFVDNTHKARVMNDRFEDILDEALGTYPWRWCRRQVEGQKLADTPPAGYVAVYGIPPEVIDVRSVKADATRKDTMLWARFENKVAIESHYTSEAPNSVIIEGTVSIGPANWPGYFRTAFITYLAGRVCKAITQDEGLANSLLQEGISKLKLGQSRDAQNRSTPRIDTGLFVRQRRSGGRKY